MATLNIKQQAKSEAKQTARGVKHATANPWVERLERFGYITRGLVYATIGVLALQLAMGAGGATTTQTDEHDTGGDHESGGGGSGD